MGQSMAGTYRAPVVVKSSPITYRSPGSNWRGVAKTVAPTHRYMDLPSISNDPIADAEFAAMAKKVNGPAVSTFTSTPVAQSTTKAVKTTSKTDKKPIGNKADAKLLAPPELVSADTLSPSKIVPTNAVNEVKIDPITQAPQLKLSSVNPNYTPYTGIKDSVKSVFSDAGGIGTYKTINVPESTYTNQYLMNPNAKDATDLYQLDSNGAKILDPKFNTVIPEYSVNIDTDAAAVLPSSAFSTNAGVPAAPAFDSAAVDPSNYSFSTGVGNAWDAIGGASGLSSLASAAGTIGSYFNARDTNKENARVNDAKLSEFARLKDKDIAFSAAVNKSGLGTRA